MIYPFLKIKAAVVILGIVCMMLLLIVACENPPASPSTNSTPPSTAVETPPVPKPLEDEIDDEGVRRVLHQKDTSGIFTFAYQLNDPFSTVKLPNKMQEISGLSVAPNVDHLFAINDEAGNIYTIHKKTGKIVQKDDFGKSGDYEGIEYVSGTFYVVKSNGTIYKVLLGEAPDTQKFETDLKTSNDVEGLGYDPEAHALLLACKGKAGEGEAYKNTRAIYAFDLYSNKLQPNPTTIIQEVAIMEFLNQLLIEKKESLLGQLDAAYYEKRAKGFAPSAIAVHPFKGDFYILSSVGKLLLVTDRTGNIKHLEFLDKSIFPQPEGIAFDKSGTLFISSEGAGGKGRIMEFQYIVGN